MKVKTAELGDLEVYVIYSVDGAWEQHWKPLQGTEVATLATFVPKETLDHALKGWSSPLVKALGLAPSGALRKLPKVSQECRLRRKCTFYRPRDCQAANAKVPSCFEPDGLEGDVAVRAAELISMWREGVYVIVQSEETA